MDLQRLSLLGSSTPSCSSPVLIIAATRWMDSACATHIEYDQRPDVFRYGMHLFISVEAAKDMANRVSGHYVVFTCYDIWLCYTSFFPISTMLTAS